MTKKWSFQTEKRRKSKNKNSKSDFFFLLPELVLIVSEKIKKLYVKPY